MNGFSVLGGAWSLMLVLISIASIALWVYCVVLFIKLARRGIQAFDLYINKNKRI